MAALKRTSSRVRAVEAARRSMRLVFQPIKELSTGRTAGYEALARFATGTPDAWFNAAHELDRGVELEMAAITEAVLQRDPSWGYLSVNVSPLAVASSRFTDFVAGLPEPRRLVLELTEHTPVTDYGALLACIAHLRDVGIRIAVDDAGSGISSFRHILMISPEVIKLDRSLIDQLDADRGRQALAELLVQFSTKMGAELVAEGIERPEEREACGQLGIRFGQGYLFGAPVDARDTGAGGRRPPSDAS